MRTCSACAAGPALDDGRVALVMGLADGGSLRDVVTIRGALPFGEVVTALTPMATALAELHEAGVVHADVSPGNVLFTTDGRPMLADLSSAWLESTTGGRKSSLGTSGFTAPEVVLGRPPVSGQRRLVARRSGLVRADRRPDAAGLGRRPALAAGAWPCAGMATRTRGRVRRATGTVDDVMAAVGPELAPLLIRMLAEHPDARPAAAEVALALYRAAAPEPVGLVGPPSRPGRGDHDEDPT